MMPAHESRKGDFYTTALSLTNPAKIQLQAELDAYFADDQWNIRPDHTGYEEVAFNRKRREHLADIMQRCFPAQIITAFKNAKAGESISPVMVDNLPIEPPERIALLPDDEELDVIIGPPPNEKVTRQGHREKNYSQAIAAGTYEILAMEPVVSTLITRNIRSHKAAGRAGCLLHSDIGADFGIFSALQNDEQAPTRFTHIRALLDDLPPDLQAELVFNTSDNQPVTHMMAADFSKGMYIFDRYNTPEAMARFMQMVEDYSIHPVICEGTMIFFNNNEIMHQSMLGKLTYIPQEQRKDAHVTRRISSSFAANRPSAER